MKLSTCNVLLMIALVACAYFELSRCQVPFSSSEIDKQLTFKTQTNTNNSTLKMASLENLIKESVIPDVIDNKPEESIEISYGEEKVEQGKELTPTQVKDIPKVSYKADKGKLYTLTMVDPDAPSRKNPKMREILHYLVVNIPGDEVEKGDTLAEYIGSGPPEITDPEAGTPLHRYIFLVYEQKNKLNIDMNIKKTSRNGRLNFSIRDFAKKHDLGQPIAANFYQAKYDSYVKILHAQLASG